MKTEDRKIKLELFSGICSKKKRSVWLFCVVLGFNSQGTYLIKIFCAVLTRDQR